MMPHVTVLMGGWSSEREVSLMSGKACSNALRQLNYAVSEIDVDRTVAQRLEELDPDAVFNALHGHWGEDGCAQGLLETLEIPYTHSGVRASAIAMHKPTAREAFLGAGIPCPAGVVVPKSEANVRDPLARPYVVKPVADGSTCGIRIIDKGNNQAPIPDDWAYGELILAETYVPGRELTVAVLDGRALGVTEIEPVSGFYDYEAKYTKGRAKHYVPARIHADAYARVMSWSEEAHRLIGCRGVSRADWRYDDTSGDPGELFLLEVNTQPGMTPLSLVPELAQFAGISFVELVRLLIEDAGCNR